MSRGAAWTPRTPGSAPADAGLSLIELTVALAIMALLIIIAIPLLSGYQASRNLDLGGQQLVSDLRAAEDRARTQHYLSLVSFTAASGAYAVEALSPTGGAITNRCALPVSGTWSTAENDLLPSGVTVNSTSLTSNQLLFSCLGMPFNNTGATAYTTDQTVVISNSAGSRTITVRASGEVTCLVTAGGQPCAY
ncbi:MAG TPA: prepilin-type N-terminal cleavage/methylation domain-containing protein [bacterium]|nr:prepilin-type N-terminal cleavage/methylation domain-containing protein [bacterium]